MHDGHACACVGVWQAMAMPAFLACDYMPTHCVHCGAVCVDIRPLHACLVMQVGVQRHTWFMDLCTSHSKCVDSGVYTGKSSFVYAYGYDEGDEPESTGSLDIAQDIGRSSGGETRIGDGETDGLRWT